MPVPDVRHLWDFDDPTGSEHRFRAAAESAQGAERLVLLTQVARALGLQERYDDGHAVLDGVRAETADLLADDRPAVAALTALERGRLRSSAGRPNEARGWFEAAASHAQEAGDTALEIDAVHMLAIVEPVPGSAVLLNERALGLARSSPDPAARRWEPSVLNNLGCALVDSGELERALGIFEEAVALRDARGEHRETQIGRWMVGWTLRLLGRTEEALVVQRSLKAELDADGVEDPYVAEELDLLQRGH